MLDEKYGGSVIVTNETVVHPFVSVTVTEYSSAHKLIAVESVW